MLFKITNGAVAFGADTVLENIDFEIRDREKIAIVGRNGAGKSTLLKCITGEVNIEEGTGEVPFSVTKVGNPVIGYLKQIAFTNETASMIDEIMTVFKPITDTERKMQELLKEIEVNPDEKKIKTYSEHCEKFEFLGGYTYKKEFSVMIKKFGFTEQDKLKPMCEFSGGQRTKIAFIKLLLSHPDILLLDEPTNHLDVTAIKWLENYIKTYKSAVVIVSHDRMFVEKTVDKVYEIEYGETRCYKGNYSDFERQKKQNYQKQLKDHEYQRAEIQRLMRLVERFRYKATKAAMVQSKLKQIERMKIIDKPDRYDLKSFHANFQPQIESVKKVLTVKELEIGYEFPLARISFELLKGQKLGVIGDNGIGKSTFLKTLVREIKSLSGGFEFGVKTQVGYFNQQMAEFASGKAVIDDFHDEFPLMNETEVRTALGAFLFSGDDVFKCVDDLSGGERVRLALCKLFKRRPNVLILDEPTNHMDIVGKETLENMLCEYTGTVVVVSHDRYFINKVADKLLVFENKNAEFYPFGYAEYELMKERAEKESESEDKVEKSASVVSSGKKTFSTPLKDKAKKERRIKKLEELIGKAEAEIAMLSARLEDPAVYSDYVKVSQIQSELEKLQSQQDEYSDEWFTLSEELENN
ncbi:MAG: ABC-F family ATP-binding cassette domain-containing protein [Clostridia bacterium]|nr:ABC-F family ATP-binding cassette domain-containing protein [Clostridia bacterium]